MAEDTAPAPILADPEALQRAIAMLQPPSATVTAPQTDSPGAHGFAGFIGDVGNVLAGGPTGLLGLGPDADASAGRKALLNFGINMLMNSGPSYEPRGFGQILASGLQGAQASRAGSEETAYHALGASQAMAQQAFQNRLTAMKEALPYLTLQYNQQLLDAQRRSALAATGGKSGSISDAANVPAYGGGDIPKMPPEYEPYFQEASKATGIPVEVLKAQAAQESGFRMIPGKSGEIGIMQVMPSTARGMGLDPASLNDPRANILAGARYLAERGKALGVDLNTPQGQAAALRAYNGGGDPKYAEHVFQYMPKGGQQTAAAGPGGGTGGATTPAPYKVAGAIQPPPTASTEAPTAAAAPPSSLPLPPEPPAEGIPVPGGSGMRVYPDGRIGTPGQEGRPPATQVATADTGTKTDATPPPAATTAPAVTAPPAAITPPPVTPTTIPDTFTEFKRQHPEELVPSDEERATWDTQPTKDQVANIKQTQANTQKRLDLAQGAIRTAGTPEAIAKAREDYASALKDHNDAIAAEDKVRQDARQLGQQNRSKWIDAREKQLETSYNNAMTARQTRITTSEQQEGEQAAKLQGTIDTEAKDAVARINDLGMLQGLSDNVGSATPMTSISVGGKNLAEWASATGIAPTSLQDKVQSVLAFRTGVNNVIRSLRQGFSVGNASNLDMNIIENMAPNELQAPETRTAIIKLLQNMQQQKIQFAQLVSKNRSNGMKMGDAIDKAQADLPPSVYQVPADLLDRTKTSVAVSNNWFADRHLRSGSLVRMPNGVLSVVP